MKRNSSIVEVDTTMLFADKKRSGGDVQPLYISLEPKDRSDPFALQVLPGESNQRLSDKLQLNLGEALPDLAASMVVTPSIANLAARKQILQQLIDDPSRDLAQRFGENEPFLWTDTDGSALYLTRRSVLKQRGAAEGLADAQVYGKLASQDRVSENLEQKQLGPISRLFNLHSGDVLIEFGAGRNYQRLAQLQRCCGDASATLICHDILPQNVADSNGRSPTLPYVSVPPFSHFLSKVFSGFDSRLQVSLADVVTSMSGSSIMEFADFVARSKAEQVVVTQSRSLASGCNQYPNTFAPRSDEMNQISAHILSKKLTDGFSQLSNADTLVAFLQFHHTYEILMFEAGLQFLRDQLAQRAGHDKVQLIQSRQKLEVSGQEALGFLAAKGPDYAVPLFAGGKLNCLTIRPGSIELSQEKDVPSGELRVISEVLHFVFTKSGSSSVDVSLSSNEFVSRPLKKGGGGMMLPHRYRQLTSYDLASCEAIAARSAVDNALFEKVTTRSYQERALALRAIGAQEAVSFVLSTFGQGGYLPTPAVSAQATRYDEYRRSFSRVE